MFGKAIRLQDATARLERARVVECELADALREHPEQEELRASYRRAARELDDAEAALAQVVAESAESSDPASGDTTGD